MRELIHEYAGVIICSILSIVIIVAVLSIPKNEDFQAAVNYSIDETYLQDNTQILNKEEMPKLTVETPVIIGVYNNGSSYVPIFEYNYEDYLTIQDKDGNDIVPTEVQIASSTTNEDRIADNSSEDGKLFIYFLNESDMANGGIDINELGEREIKFVFVYGGFQVSATQVVIVKETLN